MRTRQGCIRIGIVLKDYNINSSSNYCCGWCYYNYFAYLYSGPPHNYNRKDIGLSKIKNEALIVMNMNKGSMKFIIDDEDKGESVTNNLLDKPLVPVVFLFKENDSVEVIKC